MRTVDASQLYGLPRELAEAVIADVADHAHPRAGPGRGRRLVGAFAAGRHLVARAQHRLARPRQGIDPEEQIDIDGTEHQEQCPALPQIEDALEPVLERGRTRPLPLLSILVNAAVDALFDRAVDCQWPRGPRNAGNN